MRGRGSRCSSRESGAVQAAGGYDRGLSAQRSSRLAYGQKSRRGLGSGKAGTPRRGQVIMSVAGRGAPQTPRLLEAGDARKG